MFRFDHRFLTRRWNAREILTVGYELADMATEAMQAVLAAAEENLPNKHALLFLFILDACLKRQSVLRRSECVEAVARFVRRTARRIDETLGHELHALSVHWIEQGLVAATTVFPFEKVVLGSWNTHPCEHEGCGARFVSRKRRDVHMDFHFDERLWKLQASKAESKPDTSTNTWLIDDAGVAQPVSVQGYFHARREAKAILRLRGAVRRLASPVSCRRLSTRCVVCDVCGDALPDKRFDDPLGEWVHDDCVLHIASIRHVQCHIEHTTV